jgi:tetraacyldisaccharide 4'-kinase
MHARGFWQRDGLLPWLLAPVSRIVAGATARRVARPGWRAPVPVICCGNVGVGGAGKTTLALDLGERLTRRGAQVAFITRGYRGDAKGSLRVAPGHEAGLVGDEALLLAALAPTYVGADRAASAQLAVAAGATVLVMDDGLQNPGLIKDLSLLVVDGEVGFGNGRVLPAGPLREPVAAGAGRCQAALLIGEDRHGALAALPPGLPVLRARLRPEAPELAGRRVLAFAGIGRPSKFFTTVAEAGADVAGEQGFPDHHPFTQAEWDQLCARAAALGAELVTTPKDAVRLPPAWQARVLVAGVSLAWDGDAQIEGLLERALTNSAGAAPPFA